MKTNRLTITVKEAYTNFIDQPMWMFSKDADSMNLDPWTRITGMDRFTDDDKKYIIEYGSTGEKIVDGDFVIYVQEKINKGKNDILKSPIFIGPLFLGILLHGANEHVAFSYSTMKDGIVYDTMKSFNTMTDFVNWTKKELGISKKMIALALIRTGDFA